MLYGGRSVSHTEISPEPGDDVRRLTRWIAVLCSTLLFAGCGPGTETGDDAGSDGSNQENLATCDPISPECGGQNWQFESDPACPQTPPTVTSPCRDFGSTCYYCDDPQAAESEPGHSFTVIACVQNNETWQLQELACATD